MTYYLALLVSRIFCLLPREFAESIGRKLAVFVWHFLPKKRKRMALDNVKRCLGVSDKRAEEIVRASWDRFGPMLVEVLRFPVMVKDMSAHVQIEGTDYLKEALSLGRGAVIATSHSGNWELMGGALAALGYPIVGVAMRQKQEGMDRFINRYRHLIGMHITYKNDVREMFKLLGEGRAIGLLMDQYIQDRDAVTLEFFNRQTNCVQGPATLARFRSAPIVPMFITRNADGKHTILMRPPIFVEQTKEKRQDIRRTMQQLLVILEEHIRAYPEEWFWLHDRWKTMDQFREK